MCERRGVLGRLRTSMSSPSDLVMSRHWSEDLSPEWIRSKRIRWFGPWWLYALEGDDGSCRSMEKHAWPLVLDLNKAKAAAAMSRRHA